MAGHQACPAKVFKIFFFDITIRSQGHSFVSLIKHWQQYEKVLTKGSSHEWQTCIPNKFKFVPPQQYAKLLVLPVTFGKLVYSETSTYFFLLSSIYKINAIEHFFKGKTISQECLAFTYFNYLQLFLRAF